MALDGEVVEAFLDEQSYYSVRVEYKVASLCVFIANNPANIQLASLYPTTKLSIISMRLSVLKAGHWCIVGQGKTGTYVNRAINCGVCGKTWTVSYLIFPETVA